VLAVLALLSLATPDTAVLARDLDAAELDAVRAACAERWSCLTAERADAALADAAGLGITCTAEDTTCWQRLLAAEGLARALVASRADERVSLALVELDVVRTANGADARAALDALFPPAPAPVAEPPPPAPVAPADEGPHTVPLAVALGAGAVAVLAAGAAAFVSADLNRSLDEAAAGRENLEGYDQRNALFFALAGSAAVAAGVAIAAGAWWALAE
jgi:hypothetical protein